MPTTPTFAPLQSRADVQADRAAIAAAVRAASAAVLARPIGPAVDPFTLLSDRQRQVLALVADGLATKEIAARMGITARTVETHRAIVMDRLGLHSVAELTKYAVRKGLSPLSTAGHVDGGDAGTPPLAD